MLADGRRLNFPRTNPPPGRTPFPSAAIGQNLVAIFLKLALARTPDPIRPMRRGPDPNRPTYGSKEGGCDLGFFPGHPNRQTNWRDWKQHLAGYHCGEVIMRVHYNEPALK